jgi:hypothetical protein
MRCTARRPPVRGIRRIGFSAAPSDEHSPQSCVGGSDHLHADDARLSIPVRGPGLGQSPSRIPAAVQYGAHRLLYGSGAGRDSPRRQTGPLQHGPRRPVHPPRMHRVAGRPRHPEPHGWERLLTESCIRGTVLEERALCRGVSAGHDSVSEAQKGLERYVMRYPRGGRTRRLTAHPLDACDVENVPTPPRPRRHNPQGYTYEDRIPVHTTGATSLGTSWRPGS